MLDVEYIMGVAQGMCIYILKSDNLFMCICRHVIIRNGFLWCFSGAVTTFWSVPSTASFSDWIVGVSADVNPPFVHSVSYVCSEIRLHSHVKVFTNYNVLQLFMFLLTQGEMEANDDAGEFSRFDIEAQKLGVRGITIVVASGDDGVVNANVGTNLTSCGFNPSWPATSPYVLAVGATQVCIFNIHVQLN